MTIGKNPVIYKISSKWLFTYIYGLPVVVTLVAGLLMAAPAIFPSSLLTMSDLLTARRYLGLTAQALGAVAIFCSVECIVRRLSAPSEHPPVSKVLLGLAMAGLLVLTPELFAVETSWICETCYS